MLSTAIVECCDSKGKYHKVRILLDQGSQKHLITENLCKILQLNTKCISAVISGVGR